MKLPSFFFAKVTAFWHRLDEKSGGKAEFKLSTTNAFHVCLCSRMRTGFQWLPKNWNSAEFGWNLPGNPVLSASSIRPPEKMPLQSSRHLPESVHTRNPPLDGDVGHGGKKDINQRLLLGTVLKHAFNALKWVLKGIPDSSPACCFSPEVNGDADPRRKEEGGRHLYGQNPRCLGMPPATEVWRKGPQFFSSRLESGQLLPSSFGIQ